MKSDLFVLLSLLVLAGVMTYGYRRYRHRASSRAYRRMLERALADGTLTPEEALELDRFRLERVVTEREARMVARAVYRGAVRNAASDARLSEDEDRHLARLQSQLGLTDADLGEDRETLGRLRLLARVEAGCFPTVDAPMSLVPQEVCHWVAQASLAERLDLPGRSRESTPGFAVALASNVTPPPAASLEALRPSEEILPIDIGLLVITSRRTVFQGAKRTVGVPHARLETVVLHSDGLRLEEMGGNTRAVLLVEDAELAAAILLGAARHRREEIRPTRRDRSA